MRRSGGGGAKRPHGKLRQSQVVSTFGPGALLDLPRVSGLVGGLDYWSSAGQAVLHEPRLQAKIEEQLGAGPLELRTPPIDDPSPGAPATGITVFQFPEWFVTEVIETSGFLRSRRLVPRTALERGRYVDNEQRRRTVVPVRFVRACRRGHIGDIDWYRLVHGGARAAAEGAGDDCRRPLWVDERGTSGDLSEVVARCECGRWRSVSDAAAPGTHALGPCPGSRPWLGRFADETCGERSRLLTRTASNAYFPQCLRVISLPDRDDEIVRAVDRVWDSYLQYVQTLADLATYRRIPPVAAALVGIGDDTVMEEIASRKGGGGAQAAKPVKRAELEVLLASKDEIGSDVPSGDFHARCLPAVRWNRSPLMDRVEKVVLVHRLREVTAQLGFTRFEPVTPDTDGELELGVQRAELARETSWLPAVENHGEGVFLAFRREVVDKWAARSAVRARGRLLLGGFERWKDDHRGSRREFAGLAFVMLHSLSHLILTSVALECGYPASSLRERVYAGEAGYGILVYTASPDAEGTLGGLVEAGRRIASHVAAAVEMGRLCSNDPVCADHSPENEHVRRFLLGAACHGCLLIAETSCEQSNDFLDRALVVPTVADEGAAFFDVS